MVQRNAMKTWEHGADFLTELKADRDVIAKVPAAELEKMFDLNYHTKHVDTIFGRVFGKPASEKKPAGKKKSAAKKTAAKKPAAE